MKILTYIAYLEEFAVIEFFAGSAQLTTQMREAGYVSARLDLLYSTPGSGASMNINSPSGMALLT